MASFGSVSGEALFAFFEVVEVLLELALVLELDGFMEPLDVPRAIFSLRLLVAMLILPAEVLAGASLAREKTFW